MAQYRISNIEFRKGLSAICLGGLALCAAVVPCVSDAQQTGKVHQIGFLMNRSPDASRLQPFRQGLRALGYIEGQNITIEQRYTQGVAGRLPDLATDLVRRQMDVIVLASDPVGSRLVASLARPGGNVTGLSTLYTEISSKQLEILKEAVPEASRMAVLANPANPAHRLGLREAQASARAVQLQVFEVRGPNEIAPAFSAMVRDRARALLTLPDPLFSNQRTQLVQLAAKRRLPAIFSPRDFVEAGGLMSYGPNIPDQYHRAATFVDRILRGHNPADLPVEQPTKFELVVNLTTAKVLGVTIPQSILLRADEVIQ